jgi:hypothetical protein
MFTMAAAPAELDRAPIESFFRPSTRFRDRLREQLDNDDESDDESYDFTEVELLPHRTLQEILATGITWKDLCVIASATIR